MNDDKHRPHLLTKQRGASVPRPIGFGMPVVDRRKYAIAAVLGVLCVILMTGIAAMVVGSMGSGRKAVPARAELLSLGDVTVYKVKADVPRGMKLDTLETAPTARSLQEVGQTAIRDLAALKGKYAKVAIKADTILTTDLLVDSAPSQANILVPKGYRAVGLPMSDTLGKEGVFPSGVAIDVIATTYEGASGSVRTTSIIAQKSLVLALDGVPPGIRTKVEGGGRARSHSGIITFALPIPAAEAVAKAKARGAIFDFAVRSPGWLTEPDVLARNFDELLPPTPKMVEEGRSRADVKVGATEKSKRGDGPLVPRPTPITGPRG